MALDWVQDWLWSINTIVPPLCVELVLKDGSRYYLHSALQKEKETQTGVVRIWDFRAFDESEIDELKAKLNALSSREALTQPHAVHPKLDWANLYLRVDDIAHCIEWHDRLWPESERPERPRIGFIEPAGNAT